jgi:hypothetical protein
VKRREGKPQRFVRAIRATIIHPSDASASMVFARAVRWRNTTGETAHYRGASICVSSPGLINTVLQTVVAHHLNTRRRVWKKIKAASNARNNAMITCEIIRRTGARIQLYQ